MYENSQNTIFFSYDSLTIYDGGSSTSPMLGKYCYTPPSHVSSSNEILIHFHSDEKWTDTGFQMEYKPVWNCPGDSTCSNQGTCDVSTGTCTCNLGFHGPECSIGKLDHFLKW